MTKENSSSKLMGVSEAFLEPPAYPKTANEVIRRLKQVMDEADRPPGQALTQKEFGRLIGAPRSTIHDWYHGKLAAPIEHFLCAMERLSEIQRTELLRQLCRDCPRLQHPRLAHDPQAVNSLSGLLMRPLGLFVITGPTDALRTFLITALGNSAPLMVTAKTISGMDMHRPDSFVPVPGVLYFRNPNDSPQKKQLIQEQWKRMEDSSADVFLFNGVWTMVPELRGKMVELAKRRSVFLADEFGGNFPAREEARDRVVTFICSDLRPNNQIGVRIVTGSPG
jgi:hypothetical protein